MNMNKKTIITILLALVAMAGQAQVDHGVGSSDLRKPTDDFRFLFYSLKSGSGRTDPVIP